MWPFGIVCGNLVYIMVIWYICTLFGMLYQVKSGNPASNLYQENEANLNNECNEAERKTFLVPGKK
jgi:hypothetical protein